MRTQCHCHRTTHTHTPTFNAARTTTKHHIPIQNDHRATRTHTPSFKMQPAPQRNTTLRFKMATAPHAHARPASKCSPHHNGTPRYDRKWPLRHTETLDHNVVLAVERKYINNFFFREHHVTIEHRATTRAQFCTITCSKCCACHEKNNITCSNAAPATKKKHNVLKVLHLPRKKIITRSKCCTCHEKES